MPLQLLQHQVAAPAPAKAGADVFQRSQRRHADSQLKVRGLQRALYLLQGAVFKGQPGPAAQIETFHPDAAPAQVVDQAIKQAARIHVYIQLAGKVAPEKTLPYQRKAG